jgi:hypothetical protein
MCVCMHVATVLFALALELSTLRDDFSGGNGNRRYALAAAALSLSIYPSS